MLQAGGPHLTPLKINDFFRTVPIQCLYNDFTKHTRVYKVGVAALEEEVNQLELDSGSELVTTAGNPDSRSIRHHGHYPFHRKPPRCVQSNG